MYCIVIVNPSSPSDPIIVEPYFVYEKMFLSSILIMVIFFRCHFQRGIAWSF